MIPTIDSAILITCIGSLFISYLLTQPTEAQDAHRKDATGTDASTEAVR